MTDLVVDSSAVVAIMLDEPPAKGLRQALLGAELALIAAPTVVELSLVLEGGRSSIVGAGRRALRQLAIDLVAFTDDHAERAIEAWRRFGRGRHPAGLNFGDCITYALAEEQGLPILCVGDDFARTGWPVVDGW